MTDLPEDFPDPDTRWVSYVETHALTVYTNNTHATFNVLVCRLCSAVIFDGFHHFRFHHLTGTD